MAVEEKAFPRGGAVTGGASKPVTKKANLFDQKKKKKSVKTKKKIKHQVVTGSEPKLTALEDLSYKVLTEGMTVLGRITKITDYYLHVSMPGLVTGRVPLTQISEPYSQLLQSMSQSDDNIEALCPLSELFYKGQLVAAQVWQIRKTDDNHHDITLSLDPRNVHSAWSHAAMAKEGLVITAAVKSKEEHGYVMDCGVNGLRSFLKYDKAEKYCETFNGGRQLAVGQLVRCVVTKAEVSSVASKIELSADPDDITKQEENGCKPLTMQHILPGMRFKLSVVESMRDGVKVNFSTLTGHLHRNHIPNTDKKGLSMPELEHGSTIFGRVLYVTPIVKTIYLSALPCISNTIQEIPKPSPAEVNFSVGDVVDYAKVTGVGVKGIFLHLGRKNVNVRGFVPERRIDFNYKGKLQDNDDEITMLERLRNKFPIGSQVCCRLLHFDNMIETYVCSMEKSMLNEKYFTFADVHVGDVVPCIVEEIRKGGIAVKVGRLSGFVPATHSSDIPLQQPSKKYQPGLKITGRVLKVDMEKHTLIITLKQSLISSQDPIISSIESARKGICYSGTVVAISANGVFVSFFGDAKGFVEYNESNVPSGHKFFLGQLVRCYVIQRSNKHIRLSLIPPSDYKHDQFASKTLIVGQPYTLEIMSVGDTSLQVRVTDKGESFNAGGIIPLYQLSDDPDMCKLLFETFETGTLLTNVWCFSNGGAKRPVVFSMRSSVARFFKSIEGKIASKKLLEAVCPGWILPCTVQKIDPSFLLLEVPLASVKSWVKVRQEQVCDQDENILSLGLVEGQGIQAKVQKVLADKLELQCQKRWLWDGELETCCMHLSKFLSDQHRVHEFAKKSGRPLGAYQIGGNVSGVVCDKNEWGFVLRLSNGARGEVTFYNAQSDVLQIGTRVNGKVLNVDIIREHVEITLREDVCSTLKEQSYAENGLSLVPDKQLRGPTLLVTPEFVLVQLKGAGMQNLAYMPTFLYPFGKSTLSVSQPFFGIDRKVVVKQHSNGVTICLPTEVVKRHKKKLKMKLNKSIEKSIKKGRYFDQVIASEDIKKEEIEDDDDEDIKEELEKERRILNTENDIRIVDNVMDDISDDESSDDLSEKFGNDIKPDESAGQHSLDSSDSDEGKENLHHDGSSSETRKRKPDKSSSVDEFPSAKKSKSKTVSEECPSEQNGLKVIDKKKKDVRLKSSQNAEQTVHTEEESGKKKRKEQLNSTETDSKKKKRIEIVEIDLDSDSADQNSSQGTEKLISGNQVVEKKKKKDSKLDSSSQNGKTEVEELGKRKKKDSKLDSSSQNGKTEVEELGKRKKKETLQLQSSESETDLKKKKKKRDIVEVDLDSDSDGQNNKDRPLLKEKPTLANPGFLWDIDPTKYTQVLEPTKAEPSSDDDSDNDDLKSKKKKRKKSAAERKEAARQEEERLQKVERELLDPNRQLNSCDDFDRMVLAKPNDSAVWLQYMAFHLQATEIEKARAVAQRALKSISYREEQEKLNVWLGLLNLENLYGTSETLKTTLDQALQSNDPYKIRAHMVRMYAEGGKTKELESEVRLVIKKFKETPEMWQEIGSILMNHGYAEKSRSILQQALPHMKNKKESVSLVIQFALIEARNNNFEQAKALMDPILASYPQRMDVWLVYCDMLVKANQISEARELLERAVSQKMSARKMKCLFSKFLRFEEAHGSKESQDRVRSMAADYVKQVAGDDPMDED